MRMGERTAGDQPSGTRCWRLAHRHRNREVRAVTDTTTKGAGGYTEPTNRGGRATFAAMTADQQDDVRATSKRVHAYEDRTVAQAWKDALLEVRYGRWADDEATEN